MSLTVRAKFLSIASVVFFFYSIAWAAAPFEDINIIARLILDGADWPFGNYADPLTRYGMFLSSVGGGILAGMSVMLWGIVAPAIKRGDVEVARMTIYAFIVWYVVDGIGSYASGFPANIGFNTVYLVTICIPLVGLKTEVEKG